MSKKLWFFIGPKADNLNYYVEGEDLDELRMDLMSHFWPQGDADRLARTMLDAFDADGNAVLLFVSQTSTITVTEPWGPTVPEPLSK
ncbi:hypothetical protein [Leucobacter sp. G161]|uniref:hypothetical protein n=1 Tax=Leucobacter sp. G161 TaxID=663704 RepID=UPI00073CB4D5|nr:hypothetical protein [Leucobacter sp. G161]KUF05687.1 hypothetical protein AUL38_15955 [Leucobacter sp. G161]